MPYAIVFAILITGLSGISAQVLILRELLINFYGNELTIGVILANWLMLEAIGTFLLGRIIDAAKNKLKVFIILLLVFALTLPVSIYLCRVFKSLLGIPFGEGLGLVTICYISFLIILPTAFCHGALFSSGARLYSASLKKTASSIGRVYILETIGTVLGGIILTYLFIPYLNSFRIAIIISISNFIICLFLYRKEISYLKFSVILLILVVTSCFSFKAADKLHNLSLKEQWMGQEVIDYRNSVYGNITVTRKGEQDTFFYNGVPAITVPYPDIIFVQEFGNLPLLFHYAPKDVLVVSAGAGGIINEILKHRVKRVDYAELDPIIIEALKQHPSEITDTELSDKRVRIINLDGRFFLKTTANKYDLILIGLPIHADLTTNRLFSREFFALTKKRLNRNGILALWLPGSLTYISEDLRDLNACILNGLRDTYGFVRVIPGDYNTILASDSEGILGVSAGLVNKRIETLNIKTDILVPKYIDYRLDKSWVKWFNNAMLGHTTKVNSDTMPVAVFQMLMIWNKKFSPALAGLFRFFKYLNLLYVGIGVFLAGIIIFFIFYRKTALFKVGIAYSIATTGFFAMFANLILIFSFQIFYGYLYHKIGILISIFMAGIASGGIFTTNRVEKIRDGLRFFTVIEAGIVLFAFALAWILGRLSSYGQHLDLLFAALFFISGFLAGMEFPLAAKLCLSENETIGKTAGVLYLADLLGGWLAGMTAGIILLPLLGLRDSCIVIALFKISDFLLLGRPLLGTPKIT